MICMAAAGRKKGLSERIGKIFAEIINGLLAFFVFCVLKCVMFAKFKNDILENDTPFLFKLSNHVFGIMFIIMDLFIFYISR